MGHSLVQLYLTYYPWLHDVVAWGRWAQLYRYWLLAAGIGVVAMVVILKERYRGRGQEPQQTSYGTARLMTKREMLHSPKFRGHGVPVGKIGKTTLRLDQEENVLVVGPKGVGKSTRIMIPAILDWPESAAVVDSNGELFEATYHRRAALGPVYVFDPLNPRGDHYNMFDGIRWNHWDEVADMQRVIHELMYEDPKTIHTDAGTFYKPWANLLHVGTALHLHYSPEHHCSPQGLLQFYQSGHGNFMGILRDMQQSAHAKVSSIARSVIENKADIIKNIWSSAMISLLPWMDDKLAAVTHDTTIPVESLQQGSRPSTAYLRFSPRDLKGRLQGVARCLLDQWSFRLCDRDPRAYTQQLLWVIDDFAMLGYLEMLRDTPAENRKYGHRTLNACQSFGQIFDTFGRHAGGLLTNSTTWVMFAPMERSEADLIAAKLDDMTVTEMVDRATTRGWSMASHSVGPQSHRRALLTPDEIMRLGSPEPGWTLVCTAGERAALLRHPPWYGGI